MRGRVPVVDDGEGWKLYREYLQHLEIPEKRVIRIT
jgi:hypothetical protein